MVAGKKLINLIKKFRMIIFMYIKYSSQEKELLIRQDKCLIRQHCY